MLSLFKKPIGGVIKYYGLSEWWLAAFSDTERKRILEVFRPIGMNPDDLVNGDITFLSGSAGSLLSAMAGWFKTEQDRSIAYRLIEKAEALLIAAPVLDRHFLYQNKKEVYYRFRDIDNFALDKAIEACEQQIAISTEAAPAFREEFENSALPLHVGYTDLAIIREKQGNLEEAVRLCTDAAQQGWGGDWEKRIARYEAKLDRLNRATK